MQYINVTCQIQNAKWFKIGLCDWFRRHACDKIWLIENRFYLIVYLIFTHMPSTRWTWSQHEYIHKTLACLPGCLPACLTAFLAVCLVCMVDIQTCLILIESYWIDAFNQFTSTTNHISNHYTNEKLNRWWQPESKLNKRMSKSFCEILMNSRRCIFKIQVNHWLHINVSSI